MSRIYDALQIAQGERLVSVQESTGDVPVPLPSPIPLPLKSFSPFPLSRFYEESELLGLAQNIAARLPNPAQNVIQFIGSRIGEGTSTPYS